MSRGTKSSIAGLFLGFVPVTFMNERAAMGLEITATTVAVLLWVGFRVSCG